MTPWNYTVHGILQARILEWVVILFSRESSQPRDQIQVSCIAGVNFIITKFILIVLKIVESYIQQSFPLDELVKIESAKVKFNKVFYFR